MPLPDESLTICPELKSIKRISPDTTVHNLTSLVDGVILIISGMLYSRNGTQISERPLGSSLLALLRHLSESLHTSSTKRSVIGVPSSVKGALGSDGVAGREINHASPIATAHRSKHPLTLGITSGLGRSLRQGKLGALLAALSQLGSPVTWC